jgi:hypothetical protein
MVDLVRRAPNLGKTRMGWRRREAKPRCGRHWGWRKTRARGEGRGLSSLEKELVVEKKSDRNVGRPRDEGPIREGSHWRFCLTRTKHFYKKNNGVFFTFYKQKQKSKDNLFSFDSFDDIHFNNYFTIFKKGCHLMKLNFSFQLLFLLGVCRSVGYAHPLEAPEHTRCLNTRCLPYLTHKSGRLEKQLAGDFSAELTHGNPFRGDFSEEFRRIKHNKAHVEKFDLLNDHVNTESVRPFAALMNIFEEKCQQIKVNELKASQLPVKTPVKTPIGFRSAQIGLKKSETVGAPAAFGIPLFNHIGLRSAQIGLKKSETVGAPAPLWTPVLEHRSRNQELEEKHAAQVKEVRAPQWPVKTPIGFRSAQIGLSTSGTVGAPAALWTPVLEHRSRNQELEEKHAAQVKEVRAPELAPSDSGYSSPGSDIAQSYSDSLESGTLGALLQRSDSGYSSPGSDIAQSYSDSLEIIREIRSLIGKTLFL